MEFIQAIRNYAKEHYNQDGWDLVVECWEDKDIRHAIVGASTLEAAITKIQSRLAPLASMRREVEAEIF